MDTGYNNPTFGMRPRARSPLGIDPVSAKPAAVCCYRVGEYVLRTMPSGGQTT